MPHPPAHTEEESEEEEEEEEPVLKFEDEPLEANEVVIMPDGSEGVVEGIRRGNVVVRTENGVMETFKLEEVKRKHVAPPGYVRPESEWGGCIEREGRGGEGACLSLGEGAMVGDRAWSTDLRFCPLFATNAEAKTEEGEAVPQIITKDLAK
jgi:hypothetical protein